MNDTRAEVIEAIIQKLIEQMCIDEQQALPRKYKRHLLVLICGGLQGTPEVIRQLKLFAAGDFELKVVFTKVAKVLLGEAWLQKEGLFLPVADDDESPIDLLNKADALVVPVLTMNTAAKVCCGMADNPVTTILVQALLQEKPVFAADDACNPNQSCYHGFGNKNVLYHKRLTENIEKLQKYGVTTTAAENLFFIVNDSFAGKKTHNNLSLSVKDHSNEPEMFTGKILCAGDISKWNNSTVGVMKNTVITPAAKDMAIEKGIKFVTRS